MMNLWNRILLLAAASAVVGCNADPTIDDPQSKDEICGSGANVERVYQTSGLEQAAQGASVAVFSSMFPEENHLFTKADAQLRGEMPSSGVACAVYPYDEAVTASVAGGQFLVNLPVTMQQTLSAAGPAAGLDLSVAVSAGDELAFESLLGAVEVPLRADGEAVEITSLRMVGNNGELFSGNLQITASQSGAVTARVLSDGGSTELISSGSVKIEDGTSVNVTVKLLPQSFVKGFKLYLTKSDGVATEREIEPVTVSRGETVRLPEVLFEPSAPKYYIEYVAASEVTVAGCKGEYDAATQQGRIYLETPVIADDMFNVDVNPSAAALAEVFIPSEIEQIGFQAFWKCDKLAKLTVGPDSQLATIGESAFGKCGSKSDPLGILFDFSSVTKVTYMGDLMFAEAAFRDNDLSTLPKSLEQLQSNKNGVFRNLAGSKQETFDLSALTNLKIVGGNVFQGCKGGKLFIFPSSIETFAAMSFPTAITGYTIRVLAEEPPVVEGSFLNNNVQQIQVPAGKVEAYKAAAGWSTYAAKISAIPQ